MKKILLSLVLMALVIFIALPKQAKAETEEKDLNIHLVLCYNPNNSLLASFSFNYMPSFLYDYFDDYEYYHCVGIFADVDNTISLNKEKQFLCEADMGIIYAFNPSFGVSLDYRKYQAPFPEHVGITAWFGKSNSSKSNHTIGISIISKKGVGVHFNIRQSLTKTMGLHCSTAFYYTVDTKLLMGRIRWGQKISGGLYAVIDGRCFLFEKETKAFIAGGFQYSF